MLRYRYLLPLMVSLLAGCPPPPAPAPPPAKPAQPTSTTPTAKSSAAPAVPASVEPDTPTGADATRDAELSKQATGILAAYSNHSPRLTPDGKQVVFVSDRDGLPQLYLAEVARPEAPPLRLVTTQDRTLPLEVTPDGKSVLFQSDKGADESWSIFRVDLDGKNLVELTPGEKLQRGFSGIADRAKPPVMIYSVRSTGEARIRIAVQGLTPGEKPKIAYDAPSTGWLVDSTRDGKWAAVIRPISTSESTLELVDLEKGTAKHLYPPAGKTVRIHDATFTTDGSRLVASTDDGGERTVLAAIDVATGAEKARLSEERLPNANIIIFRSSKKGDFFVESLNAGDHIELRLLDTKTLKPVRDLAVPLGTGYPGNFSDDGKVLPIVWGTANKPQDLYLADVTTGKLTPLRKDARPGLVALPDMDVSITNVASFDGTKIPVNVYLPQELKKTPRPAPVLFSVHGGPAGASSVGWDVFRRFYSALGYVVVEPNVRGSFGFGRAFEMGDDGRKRPDGIKDLEAVGRWVVAQPWADKDRLVIFGGSYGGYSVLMGLTRHGSLWRAGVDAFGISSWKSFFTATDGTIRELFKKEVGDPDKDADFLDSISPLADAGKIAVPLFVYAGANDPRVPRSESDQIVRSLRERKVPVEYMVAANEGHSFSHVENKVAFLARSARFLEKALAK